MTTANPLLGRAVESTAVLILTAVGIGVFAQPATAQDDGVAFPFIHSDLSFAEVEPGESIPMTPTLFQEDPLPPDTAALVVNFSGSSGSGFIRPQVGIDAPYDNCGWGQHYPQTMYCVITDFEDLVDSAVTITDPVTYEIDSKTAGPVDICKCDYRVFAVNAEVLDRDIGEPTWDPDSDNLLGLTAAGSWDGPSSGERPEEFGEILVETTENPYDLAVEDIRVGGREGEEVATGVSVANLGTADTLWTEEVPGSIALRGQLPDGLELTGITSSGEPWPEWTCLESEEELAEEYQRVGATTELERFDFACFALYIDAGAERGFALALDIVDADAIDGGRIETDVVTDADGWPPVLENDLENNRADILVDVEDASQPQLPATGMSMTAVSLAATVATALGVVLFAVARRRSAVAGSEE